MIACLSPNGEASYDLASPPTRLLVGTTTGVMALDRDGEGGSWRKGDHSLSGKHIGALLALPDGTVFAGCHSGGGLHRSRDGGKTWQDIGSGINATDIYSLVVCDTAEGSAILAGVEPASIYRSLDAGATWVEFPTIKTVPGSENWTFPPPPHIAHVKSITVDRRRPDTYFACVEQGALLRTDDGGRSWTVLDGHDEVYQDAHRLVLAPWNPDLMLLATGVGVYRSEDSARSWTRMETLDPFIRYPDGFVISPSDRALFICGPLKQPRDWLSGGTSGSICRSTDEGLTWEIVDSGLGADRTANYEALSIVNYPGGYMIVGGDTDGNIVVSEDAGASWHNIASTAPVSKGAHHKIVELSQKLPYPVAILAAAAMRVVLTFLSNRAVKQRKAALKREHYTPA